MTRAQRIRDLTSEKAFVYGTRCVVSTRVAAEIQREITSDVLPVLLSPGITLVADPFVPDPVPLRRAKKFVRRLHRARLKNRGKSWI